jgi:xylan 1,4-beta-xylosidase
MNMARQLSDIENGFRIIASYPTLRHLPIIIGESDPEGCAACSEDFSPQNAYRNGTMYSSYTAASFARKHDLAAKYGINLLGAVTWAFEFEDQPWFAGFRDLATNGVNKPVLNIFRMFGLMQGNRVAVNQDLAYNYRLILDSGVRGRKADVNAFASANERSVTAMVWNYHDDNIIDVFPAMVRLQIAGMRAGKVRLSHYRVDQEFSNAYTAWKKMGSPKPPGTEQIRELERAGQLSLFSSPGWVEVKNGMITRDLLLPRQGVSLIQLEW